MGAPVYNNFQNLITFSRGSNATLFNGAGLLTYAPNNMVLQSEDFGSASWFKNAVTVSSNSVVAPDGTTTADTITENSATDLHVAFASVPAFPATTAGVFSVYLRANTRNFAMVRVGGAGFTTAPAIKATLTGAGSTAIIEGPVTASSITSVGNGWYRVSLAFTTVSSGPVPNVGPHDNGSSITYAGNGTGSVYAWGAQLEIVTYQTTPSTYVATTASAYYGPRLDYDPVTLALRGMLVEEQRINLAPYSNGMSPTWAPPANGTFATNSALTSSPDGTNNSSLFTRGATTGNESMLRLATSQANSTTYTLSVYAKQGSAGALLYLRNLAVDNGIAAGVVTFALDGTNVITRGASYPASSVSITAVGNGWYRCTITGTTVASISTNFVDVGCSTNAGAVSGAAGANIFVWGAQLEAGSFATSYIPTGATSVTRNADVATMSGSQFTPWYNGTQGTYVIQANSLQTPGVLQSFLQDGNLTLATNGAGSLRLFNGSVYTGLTNVSGIGSSTFKAAAGYTEGASASGFSVNGASPVAFTNPGLPPQASFAMGNPFSGTGFGARSINGYIRSITYYPYRLTNAQLQGLTA